ncbi:MAG: peptidyl-alpha-hydroxyglycine alpha-amidating lyase family protein [Thermodesulfobacteriota bacterium]
MLFAGEIPGYEVIPGWAKIPSGWDLVEIPGLAVDSEDRVFALTRGEPPVVVFDRDGRALDSWGRGQFRRPHAACIGPDNCLYCVDDLGNAVRKYTLEGRLLGTIGPAGTPSETGYVAGDFLSVKRGGPPYNLPTSIALSGNGEIYVTDGYGNSRVHKFSPEGKRLLSWGKPGVGPGQFHLPHGISIDQQGYVYVGDRMNSRIQVFTPDGKYLAQWNDVYQPNDIYIDSEGRLFVAEIGYQPDLPMPGPVPLPGDGFSRITLRDLEGRILSKITNPDPRVPGGFLSAHAVRTDSRGDLYVGEVSATRARNQGKDPRAFNILQKFRRMGA